jgi:alkylation response protein AidB-like acyl-CoA dehydrogenase
MDFELDDDQRELQDTVRGIVDKECSPSFVRSVIDDGIDPAGWWATMVELYWPAMAIAEDHGGLGMGWMELAILLEELGRATDPSPFVATTTQFAPAIAHCGDAAQRRGGWKALRQDRSPVPSRSVATPSPRRPRTAGGA